MKRVARVCFIAFVSLLILTPLVACGGAEVPPPAETGNQPPVITSLTAEETTLIPNAETSITCNASDPDGDELTYTWSATDGTISGVENVATWKAPSVLDEFVISVSVNDGKGGITESSCTIVVVTPEVTVILAPLPEESGSVYYDGDIIPQFRIGDNAANIGGRPYFSFDVTGLADAEIKEAKLTFTVRESVGHLWWFVPPVLYVDRVYYGARALKGGDCNLPTVAELERFNAEPPGELNVYYKLKDALEFHQPRLQFRLRLATNNNLNSQEDYIEFSKAELTVIYVK